MFRANDDSQRKIVELEAESLRRRSSQKRQIDLAALSSTRSQASAVSLQGSQRLQSNRKLLNCEIGESEVQLQKATAEAHRVRDRSSSFSRLSAWLWRRTVKR
jgi:hypothetical protein